MERERRKWKEDDENALERRRDKEFDYKERETALEAAAAVDEDVAEETGGGGDTEEENSIFHDTYRPLNL
ncbi:hypothetical protein LINGRAHAP2_LOCUS31107 [Linum grandiflorum]